MNLQILVVVLLRFISLNFLLQVIFQVPRVILSFLPLYRRGTEAEPLLWTLPWVLVIGLVAVAVALWLLALPIARLVTRGLPVELSFGTLSLGDCYSVMFLALGLFFAAGHFASVLNWIHYLLRIAIARPDHSWQQDVKWYDFSEAVIPCIVGIILFVNGRKWAVALANKQIANPHPEIFNQEKEETSS